MIAALTAVAGLLAAPAPPVADPSAWTVYVANDTCPDYTWGHDEATTRRSFAELIRAHLDAMKATDGEAPENRDRYNATALNEVLCFVERYPERREELVARIREGRLFVSPFLCNTLWGLQSTESAIRGFYPARRLEAAWGLDLRVAEHIELPSLPWGTASLLAGCGVRWLSVPFLAYEAFTATNNPPVFDFVGPDGGRVRVVMDPWACRKANYAQGARLLSHPEELTGEWLNHYQGLGAAWSARCWLASGTHSDTGPDSAGHAAGFAAAIKAYNARPAPHPRLVNATLPQFCAAIDEAERAQRFVPEVRGCFGHSWEAWPVSLARYVAGLRDGERSWLAAEALLSVATGGAGPAVADTQAAREHAEWAWTMLSDHAWNGTDDTNRRENARLRRAWNAALSTAAEKLRSDATAALALRPDPASVTVFNSLSVPRAGLVELATEAAGVTLDGRPLPTQAVSREGQRRLCFVTPLVPGYGLRTMQLSAAPAAGGPSHVSATATTLESPWYRLELDRARGGVSHLIHKPSGRELVAPGGRPLGQTVYFDGQEHAVGDLATEVVAAGPVMATLRATGVTGQLRVVTDFTVYAALERVDLTVTVSKPPSAKEERLCQVFPVAGPGSVLRVDTTGAVIRPAPQPAGDLLPGADRSRFAVQGFVDATTPEGVGFTVAPLDAFLLRLDLDPLTFECLGSDQNHREVSHDQGGETEFRFRYSLRAHDGYQGAAVAAWSRDVATPLLALPGALAETMPGITVDPARAVALCLKPAEPPAAGLVLRLWETAGRGEPLRLPVRGFRTAMATDLLERDRAPLPIKDGAVTVDLAAHGLAAVRLVP